MLLPTPALAPTSDSGGPGARLAGGAVAFGRLGDARDPAPRRQGRTRIALFGDFSGRAARGLIDTGAALAARRGARLDIDTLDDVIARFRMVLPLTLGAGGESVDIELGSIDDLHPDELYAACPLFAELSTLRQRLKSGAGVDQAIATMRGWAEGLAEGLADALPTLPIASRGASVPADRGLDDFASLIGAPADTRPVAPSPIEEILRRAVGPHVIAAPDPRAESMIAAVDAALSSSMRMILHHPEFQAVEAAWRALDMIARRVETDSDVEITLFDISAEEWASDLAAAEDLSESGLYSLLATQPATDAAGAFSAVFALYSFEETPTHAALLARMGKIAARINAPFIAAMDSTVADTAMTDRHAASATHWDALRGQAEAAWLGLAAPRIMARQPYGKRSDPIDAFAFEEFTTGDGLSGLAWMNPAAMVLTLLAQSAALGDGRIALGQVTTLDDLPYHVVTDAHGDQQALPVTDRLMTEAAHEALIGRGLIPIIGIRGTPEARLGSFQSLGHEALRGPWSAHLPPRPAGPPPPTLDAATLAETLSPRSGPSASPGPGGMAPDLDALLRGG
ncbi:MAG: type VI secretion system contractile sheath large subunit [Pseudomonadota bacterium]